MLVFLKGNLFRLMDEKGHGERRRKAPDVLVSYRLEGV